MAWSRNYRISLAATAVAAIALSNMPSAKAQWLPEFSLPELSIPEIPELPSIPSFGLSDLYDLVTFWETRERRLQEATDELTHLVDLLSDQRDRTIAFNQEAASANSMKIQKLKHVINSHISNISNLLDRASIIKRNITLSLRDISNEMKEAFKISKDEIKKNYYANVIEWSSKRLNLVDMQFNNLESTIRIHWWILSEDFKYIKYVESLEHEGISPKKISQFQNFNSPDGFVRQMELRIDGILSILPLTPPKP